MDTKKIEVRLTPFHLECLDVLGEGTVRTSKAHTVPDDAIGTLATLVIFSGEREKVYSETEVKAMLEEMGRNHDNYSDDNGHTQSCLHYLDFKRIAAKHGIQLT